MVPLKKHLRIPFLAAFLLLTFSNGYSQITNVQLLTPQEQQYLSTAKSVYKEYQKLYKQYLTDSTKMHRKLLRQSKRKGEILSHQQINDLSDSLKLAYDLPAYETMAKEYELYKNDPQGWKEVHNKTKPFADKKLSQYNEYSQVKQLSNDVTSNTGDLGQYKAYTNNPDSLLKGNKLDKLAEKQFMQLDEVQELQQQSGAFDAVKNLPKEYQEMYKQYYEQSANINKETIQSEIIDNAKTLGQKFMTDHGDILNSAQAKLSKLKKKYSYISSSNDLTNAIKLNSLSDEPLVKRIIFGGNFQLSRTNKKTNMDISPIIGYKFNKKISIGFGGVYRATFGQQDEFFDYIMEENVYGGRIFMEYILVKGFFGHVEYERMNNVIIDPLTDITYRIWSDGILVGLGKGYRISNVLNGNILVLYNTMHEAGVSPYGSPWQIRFGIGKL